MAQGRVSVRHKALVVDQDVDEKSIHVALLAYQEAVIANAEAEQQRSAARERVQLKAQKACEAMLTGPHGELYSQSQPFILLNTRFVAYRRDHPLAADVLEIEQNLRHITSRG